VNTSVGKCARVCKCSVLVVCGHISSVYWSYVRTETGSQDGYLDGGCGT
jgi:hypothetical protein